MNNREYWKFLGSMFITVMATCATMMVDAAVGGRFIGEYFVSVVNLLTPVNETFFCVALIFAAGANTVAAISFGRGDIRSVRRCFTVGLISMAVFLLLCLITILCFRDTIAWSLTDGGVLYEDTRSYLSVLVFYSVLNEIYLIVRLFTAMTGRPQMVLVCALIQMFSNFGFDLLFVKVFHLGIAGLGYASIVSVIIVLGILLPGCLKRNSAFRPISVSLNEFIDTLKHITKAGSGFLSGEVVYITFTLTMNALVLRYLGEQGLLAWSIVMMLFMMAYFTTGAAQETCISFGGRCLGVSDKGSFRKAYRNSSIFVTVWICLVIFLTIVFPEKMLPLFGIEAQSDRQGIVRVILSAIPFIFGSNILNLHLIRLIQMGKVTTYMIIGTILSLSVPLVFALFCIVAPGEEWFALTAMTPLYLLIGYYLFRVGSIN